MLKEEVQFSTIALAACQRLYVHGPSMLGLGRQWSAMAKDAQRDAQKFRLKLPFISPTF